MSQNFSDFMPGGIKDAIIQMELFLELCFIDT